MDANEALAHRFITPDHAHHCSDGPELRSIAAPHSRAGQPFAAPAGLAGEGPGH